jgi:hypothetical protein
MIPYNHKTSLLIPYQLPGFIREDPNYVNFVSFIQAYYEWLENDSNVIDRTKNILNYTDIDNTTSEFIQYFINDFLPYFPADFMASPINAVKFAKEFYQSKGVPQAFKFLFRVLYNSDFDVYYTKDSVLKASSGNWYIPKSIKVASNDPNWLTIHNYNNQGALRVFGETTKSIATVENTALTGLKTEIFISNIERLFQSGEFIRVVDNYNQDVLFNGVPLRGKLVGQISQININPNYRGVYYKPGDPVVVYGGLNANTPNPIGGTAEVGTVSVGSIKSINVLTGGFGYTTFPNSIINIYNGGGATAQIASVDPSSANTTNATNINIDAIYNFASVPINSTNLVFPNNPTANANTKLINALTLKSFSVSPISSVLVTNGGGGISQTPTITAQSLITTNNLDTSNTVVDLSSIGILGPLQIANTGTGYSVGDQITFSGGSGYGAYANVTAVSIRGEITKVGYYTNTNAVYPLGGMGYKLSSGIPKANVVSSGGVGGIVNVLGILGTGATFSANTDSIGAVNSINIDTYGEDYVSSPNVSLRVEDILVSNVGSIYVPKAGDVIYQGSNVAVSLYTASVNSVSLVSSNIAYPANSVYSLRVYNYVGTPNTSQTLNVVGKPINLWISNTTNSTYTNGIKTYGDGRARAAATFLNGLVIGSGQYLDKVGQLSGYDVLQSVDYNNFTYQITVEEAISKYRSTLLNLIHPTGLKVLGRYALKSANSFTTTGVEGLLQGHTLSYYTNLVTYANMGTDFTNKSNNIITFTNLQLANLNNIFITGSSTISNSVIEVIPTVGGINVKSEVIQIDSANAQIYLKTNTWLTFPNVAYVTANTNKINIQYLTGTYDIINNGNYSNTQNHLQDIVFIGDTIRVNNQTKTVSSIDYSNGIITLSSSLTGNSSNGLMDVKRGITTSQVKVYGYVGIQYVPQLGTENDVDLTTEDGTLILLG